MSDRIVISFDDEQESGSDENKKIIIDLDSTDEKKSEITSDEDKTYEEIGTEQTIHKEIISPAINSYFRGNSYLNYFTGSPLLFPAGEGKRFRLRFSIDIKDIFLNSILETNDFAVLTSKNGCAYFVDKITGEILETIRFGNESFEKTGSVKDGIIFLNSLTAIYKIEKNSRTAIASRRILYTSAEGYYIWSNLNFCGNNIIILEYAPQKNKANVKLIDSENGTIIYNQEFSVKKNISDCILTDGKFAFCLIDGDIIIIDTVNLFFSSLTTGISTGIDTKFFLVEDKIFLTNTSNEVVSVLWKKGNDIFRNTGIKLNYINSAGGYGDYLFFGTLRGWVLYHTNGKHIYSYEDADENRIESIGKNILAVSNSNKIIFHNLNRFQEAEGFACGFPGNRDYTDTSDGISSAKISQGCILVLSKKGSFESYTNDMLNVLV